MIPVLTYHARMFKLAVATVILVGFPAFPGPNTDTLQSPPSFYPYGTAIGKSLLISGWPSWEQKHYTAASIAFLANIGIAAMFLEASSWEGEAGMGWFITVPIVVSGLKLLGMGIDLASTHRYNRQLKNQPTPNGFLLQKNASKPGRYKLGLLGTMPLAEDAPDIGICGQYGPWLGSLAIYPSFQSQTNSHDTFFNKLEVTERSSYLVMALAIQKPVSENHALVLGCALKTAGEERKLFDFPDTMTNYSPAHESAHEYVTQTKNAQYWALFPRIGFRINEFNWLSVELGCEGKLMQLAGANMPRPRRDGIVGYFSVQFFPIRK